MSDEPEVILTEIDVTAEGEGFKPDDAPQDDQPSAEDRALSMGWTPKGQFKGDPEKWVDAETFVKRGEEFLPFLKANNKRLEKELEGMKKTLKEFGAYHSETAKREYERALRDLKAELATATAAGDADAVEKIADDIADLKADATGKQAKTTPTHDSEVVEKWVKANAWYTTDDVMAAAAAAIAAKLEGEGLTDTAEQLAEVTKRIKAEFPHKFENPRRKEPGAVEAPGGAARKGGKSRSDLPADARATMDRWVKQGIITEAQYLKDYFS